MGNEIFLVVFAIAFVAVFALVAFVGIRVVTRLASGGLPGFLLGGRVVRAFDELPVGPESSWVKSRVRVHRVDTPGGPRVGVLLTQRGPTFWRQTGFTLSPGDCDILVRQLADAGRN